MNIITAEDEILEINEPCIFLVGPTPRDSNIKSWRPQALEILTSLGFEGTVFVPERKVWKCNYLDQVEWEYTGLETCVNRGAIAAWIPRDLSTMPAFTTNVEFGYYVNSAILCYGRPNDTEKCRYLDWLYKKVTGEDPHGNLKGLLQEAIRIAQWNFNDQLSIMRK